MTARGREPQPPSDSMPRLVSLAGASLAAQLGPGAESEPSYPVREQEMEFFAETFPRLVVGFTAAYSLICIVLVALLLWLVKSWVEDFSSPCDVPLRAWVEVDIASTLLQGLNGVAGYLLFAHRGRPVTTPFRAYVALLGLFDCAWAVAGLHWVYTSETCKATAPRLFAATELYLTASLVGAFFICVNGIGLYSILRFLLLNGMLAATPEAAPEGTLERLRVLAFDPERPEFQDCRECSVCLASFDASSEIRITGCGHAFHKRCLGPWLQMRRTCPLCRADLAGAGSGDGRELGLEEMVYGRASP